MVQLSARRFVAVYLTMLGYLGDAVILNSNAIKNLPGGPNIAQTVSPSPRTPVSGSEGQRLVVDTIQVSGSPCALCA